MVNYKAHSLKIARLLEDSKAENVCVIDISGLNSWTNYFVICTVTSGIHSQGLRKKIKDYASEAGIDILQPNRKIDDGDDWNLIDCGSIVIHLMSEQARQFYDLEKLWHGGEFLKGGDEKW